MPQSLLPYQQIDVTGNVSLKINGIGYGSSVVSAGKAIFNIGNLGYGNYTVVATYNGIADKIKMPNTNPGNPRNCEWASLCHCAPLNISKLNKKYNIAHITHV